MKFIHTADLHLGRFYKGELPYEIANNRREEIWQNFENLIKYCNSNNIEVLLISGDLYEREYFTIFDMNRLKELFDSLNNTEVFIIAGNHDYISENSLYNKVKFNKNVHIFKEEKYIDIDRIKLRVHGISWNRDIDFNEDINIDKREDYKNILLLHGTIDGESYFPIKKSYLENLNLDYIALGHIHLRQRVLDNAYYPGSIEGLSFKETGSHGFLVGEIKESLEIKFIENQIRKFNIFEISINENRTISDIKEEILAFLIENPKDINKIILKGEYNNINYLIKTLDFNREFYYVDIINDLEESFNIMEIYENNKNNIIGQFINSLKDDEDSLKIGLCALMEAKNENK